MSKEELQKENERLGKLVEYYKSRYVELDNAVRRLRSARAEAEGIYDAETNLYGLLDDT